MATRLNLDLKDEKLCKAVKIRAVEEGTTLREIVTKALRHWLEQNSPRAVNRTAVTRLNDLREQIFGRRVLPGHSADFIREAREERYREL